MINQTFIGIDPGKSGAIACLSPEGIKLIDCPFIEIKKTTKSRKVQTLLIDGVETIQKPKSRTKKTLKSSPELMASELKQLITFNTIIVLENVHSMPEQGVSSTFDFGMNFGIWQGIIAALGIPMELVTPQAWKKHYGLIGQPKDASRIKALQLFPSLTKELRFKKYNGRAEALLMAEYLRRRLLSQVA